MRPPRSFRKFVGQVETVEYVVTLLRGAKAKGEACSDILFTGCSGYGKTDLARALAEEYGTNLHKFLGADAIDEVTLATRAEEWQPFDFVFFDEAHLLRKKVQVILFRVMDANEIPKLEEKDGGRREPDGVRTIEPVTLMFATDQPALLLGALKKRCPINVELKPYTSDELNHICRQVASELELVLKPQAARMIADNSFGSPRVAKQHLDGLRLFFANNGPDEYTVDNVRKYLRAKGIDEQGRCPSHRRYMDLLDKFAGRKVSLDTLANGLHTDVRSLSADVEPWLIQQGWIAIEPGGRRLTAAGQAIVAAAKEMGK